MKKGILIACVWPAFWLCLAMVSVHKDMPLRHEPEKFGWLTVLGIAAIVIPTAMVAYWAGKDDGTQ